jgi:hypothetical protein
VKRATVVSGRYLCVGGTCLFPRTVSHYGCVRLQPTIKPLDTPKLRLGQFNRRQFALTNERGEFSDGLVVQIFGHLLLLIVDWAACY